MKTLRAKLALNTILAASVLFLLGGTMFFFLFSYVSEDSAGGSLSRVLSGAFRRIEEYHTERSREFDGLAKNPIVTSLLRDGACATPDSGAVLSTPFTKNGWDRIVVVDSIGTICTTTGGSSALSPEEKSAFGDAMRGMRVQTDMLTSPYFIQPSEIFAVPIMSETGSVQAVLLGRLSVVGLTSALSDVGVPTQLFSGNGFVLLATRQSDKADGGMRTPDSVALWNYGRSIAPSEHGVMHYGGSNVIVAIADGQSASSQTIKGWKLIAVQQNETLFGDQFAMLGALLFGLLAVLGGLIFFARLPLRLIRDLRAIAYYTEQQLRGVVEFVPRNKENEIKNVYDAIERLAVRYNILAKTRDDSAIKLAQDLEACKEDRDRYAVMIGAMREGACALDNDGIITLCNLSAAGIIGKNRDEVIGKHYRKVLRLYLDEELTKEFDALEKALLSGGVFAEEGPYFLKQPGGGGLPVRIQSTVIRHGTDRAPVGIFVLMRDVGKELAVEQSKNEFISVTSHQMRTPLATMRWHIERLLRPGAPPSEKTLREYLERIERNNKRMIRLAEALLDVSRIDLEMAKGKDVEIDVPGVVKEVLDEIDEGTLSHRTITQNYDEISGQKVQSDPYLVRVVFENFIENAIAYTKPGGRIAIRAGIDGDSLRIDVEDDGIGIAPDMKDKIFSKFVRGKDATSMSPEGTGLGLYITKSLVERAGGKIWFESKRNEGTTFSVRFPLAEPES